jgi:hypothetical protein
VKALRQKWIATACVGAAFALLAPLAALAAPAGRGAPPHARVASAAWGSAAWASSVNANANPDR